jgi:hypothetical protein
MPTVNLYRRRQLTIVAASLCSLGISVLAVAQVPKAQLERIMRRSIPDSLLDGIVIAALSLIALGVLSWVLSRILTIERDVIYLSGTPDSTELEGVRALAVKEFGESFATVTTLRRWLSHRKDSVVVVHKYTQSLFRQTRRLKGFFIILPLTEHAVELFRSGQTNGASFLTEHIPLDRNGTYGVYVAGIVATDGSAKACSLLALHRELERFREAGVKTALTRPTSERGLELALRYNMQPLLQNVLHGHPLYERRFDAGPLTASISSP